MKKLEARFLNKELILNIKPCAMSFNVSQCRHLYKLHVSYNNHDITHCSELKYLGMNITANPSCAGVRRVYYITKSLKDITSLQTIHDLLC